MDKTIITGSTGFIGSHIIREFHDNGVEMVCLVRQDSSLKNIEDLNPVLRYGDIRDLKGLVNAFKGCNFVIHTAAYARDWGEYRIFYETNVEGTLNVLKACIKNGIKDIIITGTCSVYGEENFTQIKDESSPYNSHYNYFMDEIFPCKINYYRDTKSIAIQKAVEFAGQNKLNLTVIEPVWVFGEREFNTGFFEYIKSVKHGMIFAPGSRKNKFHVIYAGDLARAYYLAYKKQMIGINRIIIGNTKAETMDKIYSIFCKEAGIKPPKKLPKGFVYPAGFLMELLYTLFRIKRPPLLTRGRINMFYDNIEYSTKKAKELLGFTNAYTLEDGIRKTVGWYKGNNLI